jgi:hypothetical protein
MKYFAITQPTADWLIARKDVLRTLYDSLPHLSEAPELREAVYAAGSFRAAQSDDGRVLSVWNTDYLSSTGAEPWGFIRLSGRAGLLSSEYAADEVFERCIYAINQRLQGLLLDDRCIHRAEGSVHTCLAGRGAVHRQLSIAFVETELNIEATRLRSIVCVGPGRDLAALNQAARHAGGAIMSLVAAANSTISRAILRPSLQVDSRSELTAALHADSRTNTAPISHEGPIADVPRLEAAEIAAAKVYATLDWNYDQWIAPDSTLTSDQRRILESDVLVRQPIRLIGAAGSGKTLLMELLAMRRLRYAEAKQESARILYVVHNAAMVNTIWARFMILGAEPYLDGETQRLDVRTLFDYSREILGLEHQYLIDPDAQATKAFQHEVVSEAIREVLRARGADYQNSPILAAVAQDGSLLNLLADLVVAEIGIAIKGHGLQDDRKRYVGSERPLSRLHGAIDSKARNLVFDVFEAYHRQVFEQMEVLDTDDLALSLLGRMRTPIWEMKRRKLGYDFVFVDETQLFNENERRLFRLLTRGSTAHVPVALALDEAQQLRGGTSAGFGLLGIQEIADEKLVAVQRSTEAILRLAFHVIQRTTDLFGPDFPDFTKAAQAVVPDNHRLAARPKIVTPMPAASFGKFVLKQVRALRSENIRQIAVIVHSDSYWTEVTTRLVGSDLPVRVLSTRGERMESRAPLVAVSRPDHIGGQEFDAAILVGVEQGKVPPRVEANEALAAAMEQRALRELYLSLTRARYRVIVANSAGSAPSPLLADAIGSGLIDSGGVDSTPE